MSLFGGKDEDDTEKRINRTAPKKKKQLCLAKYQTKDSKGNKVTRTCIKTKGHWGGHK